MMKLTLTLTTLIFLGVTYCHSSSRGQGFTSSPDSLFFQCPVGKLDTQSVNIYSDAPFIELDMWAVIYGPDAKYFSVLEGSQFTFRSDTGYGPIHIRFACPANRVCKAVLKLISPPTIDTVILHGVTDDLGIEEANAAIALYPNPASDYLAITGGFTRNEIRISDVTGGNVPVSMVSDFLDLTAVPNGVYFLINGPIRQRFIVQH